LAIGGPPLALIYQHERGARIRATLAATGHLHLSDLVPAAILVPFLLAGFALSGPARRLVDGGSATPSWPSPAPAHLC